MDMQPGCVEKCAYQKWGIDGGGIQETLQISIELPPIDPL